MEVPLPSMVSSAFIAVNDHSCGRSGDAAYVSAQA
jgi:hypothetical protein